ncbi:hypothetical protein FRC20_007221 [Serendipita sp. 405]|nr:hypothetical protein FRC20_007221 [Serendipita sp. 405]
MLIHMSPFHAFAPLSQTNPDPDNLQSRIPHIPFLLSSVRINANREEKSRGRARLWGHRERESERGGFRQGTAPLSHFDETRFHPKKTKREEKRPGLVPLYSIPN